MVVDRNVFQVKFGRMREALALWKEVPEMARAAKGVRGVRIMTDVTGPAYTLVAEFSYDSLADFERSSHETMNNADWRAWYAKVVPLMDSSTRQLLTVVA